ncbi:CLUMA_CG007586, isoform A [Clunio marinus]|uniref:CLUMA_CG007586, isoform A n=1 Tax=Clunio marinus TaxID=568069 RepID=A0A1J1I136_9DIPT|nr:CLUMA_CG007586, isoform A [Clunio marinus]
MISLSLIATAGIQRILNEFNSIHSFSHSSDHKVFFPFKFDIVASLCEMNDSASCYACLSQNP